MQPKKLRLLVADDHLLFIEGLKYILKDELHIEIAGHALNGKEAIEKCQKEEFDIVLMDINMPVIDGVEATREIRTHYPGVKIIMVSMLDNLASVIKSLKAGADAYVLKNTGSADLLDAFRAVRKNETYITPSLAHFFSQDGNGRLKAKAEYIRFSENIITDREQQILKLIVEGYTDQQIAETLFLSDKTVSTHRKNMLAKLQVPNTAALVKFAMENKLV
jgi:DNA-binding NarL/FixJ family response regulator